MKPDPQTITFQNRLKRQSAIHEAALKARGVRFDGVQP